MNIGSAIEDAEQRLMSLRQQLAQLEHEIEETEAELRGLKIARRRHEGTPEPKEDGWGEMKRTDAIVRALRELGRPVAPSEAGAFLRDHGRTKDENYLVSASLAHLQKTGRVASQGRGQWVVPDDGGEELVEEK